MRSEEFSEVFDSLSENNVKQGKILEYKSTLEQTCVYCGETVGPFDLDHLLPASRGGPNHIDNLVIACSSCNSSKGPKTLDEWLGDCTFLRFGEELVRVTHTIREDQLTALDRLAIELYSDRSKLIRRYIDEGIKREEKK